MERTWKVKRITYEDLPLIIRYSVDQDLSSSRPAFPCLAVITHQFSKVMNNGFPDPEYNDTLFEFDMGLRDAFESSKSGIAVLIETFAGKRNYYIYTIPNPDIGGILSDTIKLHPQHKITWLTRSDRDWSFIEKYTFRFLKDDETGAGE